MKKFELVAETKTEYAQHTLYQVRALISFTTNRNKEVKAVFGNAEVYGAAYTQ